MKILTAVLINTFFSFIGFTVFLILFRPKEGWMATDTYNWLKISAVISFWASIPFGVFNGLILSLVRNNVILAILLALFVSLLLAIFFFNAIEYNQLGIYKEDFIKVFFPSASLFAICLICNVSAVFLLKWKFPDTP
jgi:hypothetical protein